MAWIIGIDEAGYGPNLGPFVMTSVACRVPDPCHDTNLWRLLRPVVRQGADADDGRLLIDDSKIVYTARGLAGLERGVWAALGRAGEARCLLSRRCWNGSVPTTGRSWAARCGIGECKRCRSTWKPPS